jgi:Concanavalin A-like lectin/glucanases superfamily
MLVPVAGCALAAGCGNSTAGTGESAMVPRVSTANSRAAESMLSASVAAAATNAQTQYDRLVLADTATAYYRMNDVTKLLHDYAPNAKHGNHGTAERLGVPGLTSANYTAAAFPGGDYSPDRVATVLPTPKLQPPIVSLEAWVEPSALNVSNRYQPVVSYGRYYIGTAYQLAVTPINQFFFSVRTATGSPSVVSKTTSSPGSIFHIIGTYDGASLKLYVNGILEGQSSGSGAINYGGLYSWTGLGIGSGFDASPAHLIESYAGTIADVSIYNRALTPAQSLNHFLAGVATPTLAERAASADAFVDSIGVNAPFNYQGTQYDTQYSSVKSLLISSGIRHIRSGMARNWTTYFDRLNELGRSGIHSQLVTNGNETASQLESFPALVPQSMEAYEGPNEPDLGADPDWLADTRAFMQRLQAAVKGNAATARFPILGPSIVRPANATALGNLSADLDYGNIHPYYGPYNPGNAGTGSISSFGRNGSTQYDMNVGAQISGTKPMIASETGFGTNPSIAGNVSERCDGKETPRTFLVHFKKGIVRTLAFQFVESGTVYGRPGLFSNMGLLRQDLVPKPSYNAVKSLITLLSDKGSTFATSSLTYTIRGDVANLQHLLMQKRNGTYYLALWLEVPSWNAAANVDIDALPQAISVSAPSSVKSGTLYTLNDAGNMLRAGLAFSGGTAALQISDRVTVLAFHP